MIDLKLLDKHIHQFPGYAKAFVFAYIVALSFGYISGYKYLFRTTEMKPNGIEVNYNGNEEDEHAEKMVFRKPEKEMLTIIHTHATSMAQIFFCLGLVLLFAKIPEKLKTILLVEPFVSIILTFGGIWLLWKGVLWMKYIVMFSGIIMTLSVFAIVLILLWQL